MRKQLISYSPATLEEVGVVDTITPDEIQDVVERSKAAQKQWEKTTPKERIALFMNMTRILTQNSEDVGHLAHLETGKPKAEALNTEVLVSAGFSKYCEKWLKKFKFEKKNKLEPINKMMWFLGRSSVDVYKPAGVVLCITPFNYPFCIPFTETATAVATGNSVIIKPSPETPLCGKRVAELFEKAGFPKDLVQCVNGDGIGEALTSSKMVQRIQFTGSTKTGKAIMKSASENLIPVSLELGGCDPMVVLDDADFNRAVKAGVWGAFCNAGQVCVGAQRILVHRSIYDKYVEKFVERTKTLKIGCDWNDPEISIGPVINEQSMNNVLEHIEAVRSEGAKILCGGKRAEGLKGYFIEPTVAVDVPTDSDSYIRETFGPFVTITPFDTDDEAIELANIGRYALGGSVWTKDYRRARKFTKRIDSGIMAVNNLMYLYGMPTVPWGGRRESGFGRSHGIEGFLSLMEVQHVHYDKGRYPNDPWWMPYNKKSTDLQEEMPSALFLREGHILRFLRHALPLYRKKD